VDRESLRRLRAQPGYLPSFALGAGLAGPVATGLGSAEALVVAALMQLSGMAVGTTLARLPARALPQASPGG
jgi:hypothetical protein